MHCLVGAAGFDKGHQLALIIGSTATGENLAAVANILDCRGKRVVLPQFQWIDRLNVIMPVEQDMRGTSTRAFVMGNNHRVPRRVTHASLETDRFQIGDQPLGSLAAFGLESWIGRDGLDFQQVEKPLQAVVKVGINRVQNRFESWHGIS